MESLDALHPGARGIAQRHGAWSLCFGAGICIGVLPSWAELARTLLNASLDAPYTPAEFQLLKEETGWNFDTWIQTALNAAMAKGRTQSEFIDLVEDILYE